MTAGSDRVGLSPVEAGSTASVALAVPSGTPKLQGLGVTSTVKAAPPKSMARVSSRKPNPKGRILVLMYHRFGPRETRYVRSYQHFKADLEAIYKLGFRPVTLHEYVSGRMAIPPGASPVVFTFDDSHPSQFRYLKDGRIDPNSAVGMWSAFSQKHTDFPIKATWFVNFSPLPFGEKATVKKKFDQLKDWGGEIASHTISHPVLPKCSPGKAEREVIGFKEIARKYGAEVKTFAYPYGIKPKDLSLIKKGYVAAVLAGDAPAWPVSDRRFNAYSIPRVEAAEISDGIGYWLKKFSSGKAAPYVAP